MFDSIETINISDIDLADTRYKISDSYNDITALSRSISETGLINPVIVRVADNGYIVVSGFRRIKACLLAGISMIKIYRVALIDDAHLMDLHCLKISITDKAFKRELSVSETIRSVSRLNTCIDINQISEMSVSVFRTHLNSKIIADYCTVAKLPSDIFLLFHENKLALKSAIKLAKMPHDHAVMFLNLFREIKVSSSKQLDILTLCHEIAAREKIELKALLRWDDVLTILEQENPDQVAKGNQIRTLFNRRRFPRIQSAERKFNENIKKLSLKNDISISHSRDFEGIFFEASFQFQSLSEFSQKVDKLRLLSQDPLLEDLMS